MEKRIYIQKGSLATHGLLTAPAMAGYSTTTDRVNKPVKKVHLIFKTQLDIGFTKLDKTVVKTYMDEFIPKLCNPILLNDCKNVI